MSWRYKIIKSRQLTESILIEGLPGFGNVGKIVVDFLIDELKAKKIVDIFSHHLPNSVFVNERNLVELAKIEIYHATVKGKEFLFLAGDVQPLGEEASFAFAEQILTIAKLYNCRQIVTLGGVGLDERPASPQVYCTGNNKAFIGEFKPYEVQTEVYGVVGPIIGVSGLLLGLSGQHRIRAVSLLGETSANPMDLGVDAAKQILAILKKKFGFVYNLAHLDQEMDELLDELSRRTASGKGRDLRVHYIG